MCNLYSITTNQEAISRLFRVINRYVGNLPPMPGVFPDYPAPVPKGLVILRAFCDFLATAIGPFTGHFVLSSFKTESDSFSG